ncbi:hypothetical protein Btru_039446 [Bulinus truncatus]|nr:hypothetical protein Btru_039446 [Bulinus truncatus]
MEPLKDGIRHGSGVLEMTMSLSGPPGFTHHTTLSSDNLHHYMNRQHQQQKLVSGVHDPRASALNPRVIPVDTRGGGGHGGLGLGHDPRVSMDMQQHQGRDMARSTHDGRSVESMVSKEPPPRLVSEIQQQHHHQMSMQQHRVDSRSFADPRVLMPQDKRGAAPDSRSSRDSMMIGETRGGQLPMSASGRSARPPQQSSMPPLAMTVYDSIEPGMAVYPSLQTVSGGSIISQHGAGSGKSSLGSQSMAGSQMVLAYSGQKSGRSTDSLIPAGAPIHHTPEHSMYMSGKPSRTYHGEHQKLIAQGHYMPEGVKGSMDGKQVIVHNPGDQMSPQHRDMMREHGGGGGDIRERDLRYSSAPPPMSRGAPKSSLELSSNHMKHSAELSLSDVRRQEEHMRKSVAYSVGAPPQGMYKPHGIEPHSGLTKSMTYPPLGVDVSHRGGQAPPSLNSHVSSHPGSLQSVGHSSYPSPQSDRGVAAFPMEQHPPGRVQRSVPRPGLSVEEMSWRDGGYPSSDPSKQPRPVYHGDEMSVGASKNVPPHMSDLESSHPTLRDVGLHRMQGSISTGQPRIIYDTPKSSNYPEQRVVPSSDRFTTSQRDYAPPRPSSIGRGPQTQPASLVLTQDERQEKNVGGGQIALDLTKLPQVASKQGDSPLDLTVKTKKRPLEDADNGEHDRLVSAAKRPKTETNSLHSGLMNQKGGGGANSVDMSHNPIWISSPSPRGPESYESLASPSYSSHMSPVSTVSRQSKYGYSMDGRISADSRMTSDGRLSVDGRASVESRSNAGCRTPSSPHLHGKFPMVPPLGKAGSSSVMSDMVKHAGGNPPMVPLTTQLLKVKEEQAQQRKLQKMGGESAAQSPYADSKRLYKDNLSPRTMDMVAGGANEVIVVRHPQQHYDLSPQHQHSLQHTYKQQQQHLQQQQQQHIDVHSQQLHQQHRQKLNESHEIIELGMKDSSDPLQASRSSFAAQGRSFGQGLLQQQQHQQQQQQHQQQQHQLYLQQRQMPLKEQMISLQPYSHSQQQQPQYSKEQMMQQQSFAKQPSHSSATLQHYQNSLYPGKQNEAGYYQKQLPSLQSKHSEMKPYKQTSGSSQHTPPGNQKWNIQQKAPIKTGYPQPLPNPPGNYFPLKAPSKSSAPSHSSEQQDGMKLDYSKQDRAMKSDFLQSGPLPSIGVREESRRASLRRVSYPSTEQIKQPERRKESTSSLPEKSIKQEMMVTTPEASGTECTLTVGSSSSEKVVDVVKIEDKSSPAETLLISQKKSANGVSPKDPPAPGQFAVPLSVTIPQSTSPLITSTPSPATCSTPKSTSTNKACWSKKHMILNAVNKDEDLKRIISNTATRKHEAGGISAECKSRIIASSTCSPIPTSPKMPILSPQEDEGDGANEDLGVRAQANNDDPPTLAPIKRGQGKSSVSRSLSGSAFHHHHGQAGGSSSGHTSSSDSPLVKEAYKNNNNNSHDIANNNNNSFGGGPSASIKDVPPSDLPGNAIVVRRCSLGANQSEHQIPPVAGPTSEDSQKSSSGNVSFPRAEVIRRNYLDGPWGHVKNIPIANVAPFVHSRVEDEKLKLQKIEELTQLHQQGAAVSAPTYLVQSQALAPDGKEESPRVKQDDPSLKSSPGSPDKELSLLLASSSKKQLSTTKKKKLAKLRVSSPTKMKDLESLEFTVLKSAGIEDIKSLEKLSHSAVKKSLENRMKYKHKIVREKNVVMKPKKTVKKRIQYLYDDDDDDDDDDEEPDEEGDLFTQDEDDEDFEYEGGGGDKSGKDTSKSDADAKIRDREERALRREQLRDQSEESTGRHSVTSSGQPSVKSREKNKLKTRTKNLSKSKTGAKGAGRISRRRVSSTNQRAQELKHNAIVQRRNTGKFNQICFSLQYSLFTGMGQLQYSLFTGMGQLQYSLFTFMGQLQYSLFTGMGQLQYSLFTGMGQLQYSLFTGMGQLQYSLFTGMGQLQYSLFTGMAIYSWSSHLLLVQPLDHLLLVQPSTLGPTIYSWSSHLLLVQPSTLGPAIYSWYSHLLLVQPSTLGPAIGPSTLGPAIYSWSSHLLLVQPSTLGPANWSNLDPEFEKFGQRVNEDNAL